MTTTNAVLTLVLAAAVALAAPPSAAAQTGAKPVTYELVLRDGSRVFGTVVNETDAVVTFRTVTGVELTAPRADIVTLEKAEGRFVRGEFQRADPNVTRLLFGPTARALPRGRVYLSAYQALMPTVQGGVTDRFSFGAGTPLMFGGGEDWRPFWVTPKLQLVHHPKADVAVGAIHVMNLDGESAGIAYTVMTTGSEAGSITGGLGLAYGGDGRAILAMVGGDRPLRRNIKFITENYVGSSFGLLSAGIRFYGERLSADLGIAMPIGDELFLAVPIVNFVYLF